MLDLLETIAGGVVLAVYLIVSVVLPSALIAGFVYLSTSLLRVAVDTALVRVPRLTRIEVLRGPGRVSRSLLGWATGLTLFLALVGAASGGFGADILLVGFTRTIEVLVALQDIVAWAFTGRPLNDMLVHTQSDWLPSSLRLFETITATNLHQQFRPGVTLLAFRWTFAAFATALFVFYVLLEPLRAVRRRVAQTIENAGVRSTDHASGPRVDPPAGAQAMSATPQPASAHVVVAALPEPAPGAEFGGSHRVLVTRDPLLAETIRQRFDLLGLAAPSVVRSVAQAFALPTLPECVLVDARQLAWVSVDNVRLAERLRMVAVTQPGAELPSGWHIDRYALASGVDGLLELLRDRGGRA